MDWIGCYKNGRRKIFKKVFGKYRIAGKVEKCKEKVEKLNYRVFGVGVSVTNINHTLKARVVNKDICIYGMGIRFKVKGKNSPNTDRPDPVNSDYILLLR